MSDFVRLTLERFIEVLVPTFGKVIVTVLAYLFVGPAELYHLAMLAIVLDTLTGLYRAYSQRQLNSHTLRLKLTAKVASYAAALGGAGLLYHSLRHIDIADNTLLFAVKFVLVSIVVTEVLSMWENMREITGHEPVAKKAFRKFLDQFSDQGERR